MGLYERNALECSRITTLNYSTSFSLGIRMLKKEYRDGIYAIYGFVRIADEVVDTLHEYNKVELLKKFWVDTWEALDQGVSTNPILQSFQWAVHEYGIERELINDFLRSMETDLYKSDYNPQQYNDYIYGSAEVVGLMCLHVFYKDEPEEYQLLKPHACSLGKAFQKINFLRDIQGDHDEKGRVYFPGVDFANFRDDQKAMIEAEIQADFDDAFIGVKALRKDVRLGVYLSYIYYRKLMDKIRKLPADKLVRQRVRVSDSRKILLLVCCWFRNQLNWI
jgi:phytoene synthase